jgi:hypothetical protein
MPTTDSEVTNVTTTTNITTKWFATDNTSGSDFTKNQQISVTTAPEYPGPQASLGDTEVGNNGSLWMFVQASNGAITAGNVVAIDCNFAAYNLTASLAASLKYNVGVAVLNASLASVNTGDYFWACLRAAGGVAVNVVTTATGLSALSGTQLWIAAAQPGAVMSTQTVATGSVVNGMLKNIYLNSTLTGTTTTVDCAILYNIVATA